MNAQTAEQLWTHAVNQFMDSTARLSEAAGGIDFRKYTEKWSDLDGFVRRLAARTEHAHQSMDWFLEEAHKRVLALHGMSPTAKAAEVDSSAEAKPALKAMDRKPLDRKPPLDIAPKALAMVPGSERPGDMDGEFADVLASEGLPYEQALYYWLKNSYARKSHSYPSSRREPSRKPSSSAWRALRSADYSHADQQARHVHGGNASRPQ
jgi:hypothetical protein